MARIFVWVVCCAGAVSLALAVSCVTGTKALAVDDPNSLTIEGDNPRVLAQVQKRPRRDLNDADLVWAADEERCYIDTFLPTHDNALAVVTVPDDWCKGMR